MDNRHPERQIEYKKQPTGTEVTTLLQGLGVNSFRKLDGQL